MSDNTRKILLKADYDYDTLGLLFETFVESIPPGMSRPSDAHIDWIVEAVLGAITEVTEDE